MANRTYPDYHDALTDLNIYMICKSPFLGRLVLKFQIFTRIDFSKELCPKKDKEAFIFDRRKRIKVVGYTFVNLLFVLFFYVQYFLY